VKKYKGICSKLMGVDPEPFKIAAGSSQTPVPGWDVRIVPLKDSDDAQPTKEGQIIIKLPLPPCAANTLWRDEKRFVDSYLTKYPGFFDTADAGHKDADGNVYVMARTDDIINVAAHRLSTSEMEEVLNSNPHVVESAVVGAADAIKGEIPVGFAVLRAGTNISAEEVEQECMQLIRSQIGPLACYRNTIIVNRLPKTRSGKILRGVLKKIINGQEYKAPATIDDPAALDEATVAAKAHGFPRQGQQLE